MVRLSAVFAVGVALLACAEPNRGPEGRVGISVAPLSLPSVVDACYALEVRNDEGATVWSRANVCASQFGDQRSAISFVGPCDASDSPNDADTVARNTIILKIEGLYGPDNSVPPADGDALPDLLNDWKNPCAAPYSPDGCVLTALCAENADTQVEFNLTIMREANQGFFDIAVNFDDIFCSAKVDCQYADPQGGPGRPIELVHHPKTGERVPSIVWAFACTDGDAPGDVAASTHLYMSDLKLRCGTTEYPVHPSEGPGNLYQVGIDPPAGPFVQAMVFEGQELIKNGALSADKLYWNVALGLNTAFFTAASPACHLVIKATASRGPLDFGETPPDTSYPFVDVDVVVNSGAAITCSQHGLDQIGAHAGVSTAYTTPTGGVLTFNHVEERADPGVDTHPIGDRCRGVVCTPTDVCVLSACEPTTGACVETPNAAYPTLWNGDAVLTNQASVDALACVERITGTLRGDGATAVTSVNLPRLRRIDGSLQLQGAAALTTLAIAGVNQIGGNVDVRNTGLVALDLHNVPAVGQLLRLSNNNALVTANFSGLTTLVGDLELVENPVLTSADFDQLTRARGISINGNGQLASLGAAKLGRVGVVENSFDLRDSKVPAIDLHLVTALGSRLYLIGNSELVSADFSNVTQIASQLLVQANVKLETLDLSHLARVDTLGIHGNSLLASVGSADFATLVAINGSFDVRDSRLQHLDVDQLPSLGGILYLLNNPLLVDASFASLTQVGNDLLISGNASLTAVDVNALTRVNSFSVSGNVNLASLGASNLGNLHTVTGAFGLSSTRLTQLDLHQVTSIAAQIQLIGNALLTQVDLSGLVTITGNGDGLYVTDHANLEAVLLGNLQSAGQIYLANNAKLASLGGGLGAFTTTPKGVHLIGTKLPSVDLRGLVNVPTALTLRGNSALASADLSGLVAVGTDLSIDTNVALTNLAMLALDSVGGTATFVDNVQLSECSVDALQGVTVGALNRHGNQPCP